MNYRYRGGSGNIQFNTEWGSLEYFEVVAGATDVTFQIGGTNEIVTLPAGFSFKTNKFCTDCMCCQWQITIAGEPLFWFVSWCVQKKPH